MQFSSVDKVCEASTARNSETSESSEQEDFISTEKCDDSPGGTSISLETHSRRDELIVAFTMSVITIRALTVSLGSRSDGNTIDLKSSLVLVLKLKILYLLSARLVLGASFVGVD